MKKILMFFILVVISNFSPSFADGFWYNVLDEVLFEFTRSRKPSVEINHTKKIYRIGTEDVSYSSINPNKIERIGSKRVEYKMVNDEILKIGDDFVTYSLSGKILKVGDKEVFYSGDEIIRIGDDDVYYR